MSVSIIGTTRGTYSPLFGPQPYHLSFTLGTPTDGHSLMAVFVSMPNDFSNPWSIGPSGWTLVQQGTAIPPGNAADQTYRWEVWRRTASSDSGVTYTWTWTNTAGASPASGNSGGDLPTWGDIIEWSGLSTSAAWTAAAGMSVVGAGPVEQYATPITSANAGDVVFNAFWPDATPGDDWSNTSLPSGYTSFISASDLMAFWKVASAGGTQTGTASNSTHTNNSDVERQPIMGITMPQAGSVASAAGTSTASAAGTALKPAVGSAAGTTPVAIAHSGIDGQAQGTSTATATGALTFSAAGSASGAGTALSITGLRQSVGYAAGTSSTGPQLPDVVAAQGRTDVDHITDGLKRLCQQFLDKQVPNGS